LKDHKASSGQPRTMLTEENIHMIAREIVDRNFSGCRDCRISVSVLLWYLFCRQLYCKNASCAGCVYKFLLILKIFSGIY